MISYLIEGSVGLIAFYTFYWLVLRNSKLLQINRAYLIITSLLAISFPFMDFPLLPTTFSFELGAKAKPETIDSTASLLSFTAILLTSYFIGLGIRFIVLIQKLRKLSSIQGRSSLDQSNGLSILEVEGTNAFSFFNRIYIGSETMADPQLREHALLHELAHARGRHSLDLLYFELLEVVFWFNPIAYLFTRSVKIQHEYIADQSVADKMGQEPYSQSIVKMALIKINPLLVSQFGQQPIQQRLYMLNQTHTSKMKRLRPMLALPIAGMLFIIFACSENEPPAIVVEEVPEVNADALFDLKEVIYEQIQEPSENSVNVIEEVQEVQEVIYETGASFESEGPGEVIIEEQY